MFITFFTHEITYTMKKLKDFLKWSYSIFYETQDMCPIDCQNVLLISLGPGHLSYSVYSECETLLILRGGFPFPFLEEGLLSCLQ